MMVMLELVVCNKEIRVKGPLSLMKDRKREDLESVLFLQKLKSSSSSSSSWYAFSINNNPPFPLLNNFSTFKNNEPMIAIQILNLKEINMQTTYKWDEDIK